MSIDKYHGRVYSPGSYNCLHLAAEVWLDITGQDLQDALKGLVSDVLSNRSISKHTRKSFDIFNEPCDPCLVLLQRPKLAPHIGVWLEGSVLHLQGHQGVQYMPLHIVRMGFRRVRFFTPVK